MKKFASVLLFLAALMIAVTPAFAAKKVRWKLAMSWSSTLAPLSESGPWLAQMVSDMTGGNFEIRTEGSEKHKAPLGILDMVKGGQYEIGHSASYYWKGKDVTTTFFHHCPVRHECCRADRLVLLRRWPGIDAESILKI